MNWRIAVCCVFVTLNGLTPTEVLATNEAPCPPGLPKVFLETSIASTAVTGKTIDVGINGDFQAALNKAQPGDEIVLQAGATFQGNFILPAKQSSGKWITIRTSNMVALPKEGTRVSPRDATAMPKIVAPNANPAISTALRPAIIASSAWRSPSHQTSRTPGGLSDWAKGGPIRPHGMSSRTT